MCASQFGIMIVVIVVRTAPDAARAEGENAKYPHEHFRDAGGRQNRMMLLIMVDDKQSQDQQTRDDAAEDLADQMEVPDGARQRRNEKKGCREDVPPALERIVDSECLGGFDKFGSGAH
jgi:hypothetical protein